MSKFIKSGFLVFSLFFLDALISPMAAHAQQSGGGASSDPCFYWRDRAACLQKRNEQAAWEQRAQQQRETEAEQRREARNVANSDATKADPCLFGVNRSACLKKRGEQTFSERATQSSETNADVATTDGTAADGATSGSEVAAAQGANAGLEAGTPAPPRPTQVGQVRFASEAGKNSLQKYMNDATSLSNKSCIKKADDEGFTLALAAFAKMKLGNQNSMLDAADASVFNTGLGAAANKNVARRCAEALKFCQDVSQKSDKFLSQNFAFWQQNRTQAAGANNTAAFNKADREMHLTNQDKKIVAKVFRSCQNIYGKRTNQASLSAVGYTQDLASSGQVVSDIASQGGSGIVPGDETTTAAAGGTSGLAATEDDGGTDARSGAAGRNDGTDGREAEHKPAASGGWNRGHTAGLVVGIGAVGGLVYHNRKSSKSNPTYEQQVATAAAADPNCESARSFEFEHCQPVLLEACSSKDNLSSERCKKYSDNYCGVTRDPNVSAVAQGVNGVGTTSKLCQNAMAVSFCAQGGRTACYSCMNSTDAISEEQMSQFKATCPGDPVYAQPEWATVQPKPTVEVKANSYNVIGRKPASR